MRHVLWAARISLYAIAVPLFAQHDHGAPAPAAAEKPATLFSEMGTHRHPISTSNPEAQKFFDQGIVLLYGFNHEEAIRSFARAAELDPKAAMPHWGMALALGSNYNEAAPDERLRKARVEVEKAVALSASAPPNERAYIEALTVRYSADPAADKAKLARDYHAAMKALSEKYPDDLDAATLYAESGMNLRPWKLWKPDGTPEEGTVEIVATLESVLKRDPMHPGANHYYVHAVEASSAPERALPSAERLKTLVPAAGHLVHMPAHIQIRTGDLPRRGEDERGRGGRRPRLHPADRSPGPLSGHVLQPQRPLSVGGGRDGGSLRRSEEGGGSPLLRRPPRRLDGSDAPGIPGAADDRGSPIPQMERRPEGGRPGGVASDRSRFLALRAGPWLPPSRGTAREPRRTERPSRRRFPLSRATSCSVRRTR
jgi:hypothetical protein